ncbi:MAG: single-stranded DNA-binding protein [Candidatus Omnitrophica bacterium]|nr:single-stranded DNA-binding protein [Candidatus Omnitrophota bacterium]
MANFNKVFLIGNLTRDPELRYTPSGTAVANLRIATNRRFKDKEGQQKDEVCFVTVVTWNKQAEVCNQYLQKGRPIFVEGRLQSRSWQAQDGSKRNVLEVRAERVQFLGGASKGQDASVQTTEEKEPAKQDSVQTDYGLDPSWSVDEDVS